MAVIELRFQVGDGLSGELGTIDAWFRGKSVDEILPRLKEPKDYFSDGLSEHSLRELISAVGHDSTPLKIIDIGAGIGRTSVYLASRGHDVSMLEPSAEQCRVLDEVAAKLGVRVRVFRGVAEAASQIGETDFDLCIFNASLHHCEDPVGALKGCLALLKPGGRVLLLDEPVLKPFRTKSWFARRLREDPQAMGHYGGNEHVYYAWEYPRMLRQAGFRQVRSLPSAVLSDLRANVLTIASARTHHGYVYSEGKLIQHFAWNALMNRLLRNDLLAPWLKASSLIPLNFEAVR